MAPHDTNTPKEARRHAVPLIGMAVLVVLVILGFVWWFGHTTDTDTKTEPGSAVQETTPAKPNP